ncbi:MAG: RHS repeat domain-containing protein [Pyrinomonadaceae bacterium]
MNTQLYGVFGAVCGRESPQTAAYGTPETIHNFRYDKVGQVKKHTQSIGSESYLQEYGYNLAGQLTSQKYPSGKVVTNTIDNFGRLATVADGARTLLSAVTFNNQGLLSQLNLGNGNHETFSYNDRFQMTSQSLMKGTTVMQKYDYGYGEIDGSGNLDAAKNNGQLGSIEGFIGTAKQWTQKFQYDSIGRLKQAEERRGDTDALTYKQVFDFDRFGNLYRKAANNPTTGQANPLPYTPIEDSDISKSTNRFTTETTYNEAGMVTSDDKFRDMAFSYDANGRMVKATRSETPDAWTVYDALGNRVAAKVSDVWRFSIYDAFGKLVAEYGQADEGVGGISYIQQDWQGSVRTVTNSNGFVVSRTDHTAFGESIPNGTGLRSTAQGYWGTIATRQGYGLTERDEATGLDHTWFRKNEGQAGRWTSPDPYNGSMRIGDPQTFNRYSYVVNQPTNFIDPSGLCISVPVYGPGGQIVGFVLTGCDVTINGGNTTIGGSVGGGGLPLTLEDLPPNETGGDPGGGGGSNQGTTPTNSDKEKKEKAYKDCVKAETRKCETEGRAYFNDNFYKALVFGPTAGVVVRTGHGIGQGLGFWGAIKAGFGAVITKAGPYVAVVTSTLAVAALTRAAVAIENGCKTNLDELCRRRAGLL